jgi:hypothetical protein
MKSTNSSISQAIKRIAIFQITLLFTLIVSFGQETKNNSNPNDFKNNWWYPIVQKHKIDLSQFNYRATFSAINSDNIIISHWLELGHCDTLKDQYLKLKNAIIIVMFDTTHFTVTDRKNYSIQYISNLMHDLGRNTIDLDYYKEAFYDIKNKEIIPLDSQEGYASLNFNYGMKIAPNSYKKFQP